MKDNKRAFIAKELLNMPDCVSLIIKELKVDFIILNNKRAISSVG